MVRRTAELPLSVRQRPLGSLQGAQEFVFLHEDLAGLRGLALIWIARAGGHELSEPAAAAAVCPR